MSEIFRFTAPPYCLKCDSDTLTPTPANTKSRDFVCGNCSHGYELKSKCGIFSTRILDGAYATMVKTIRDGNTPTFLLLEYSASWSINGLRAIHHSLITETSVEARKPLAPSARRAGWIGCNILLPAIAMEGQIPIVQSGSCKRRPPRETPLLASKIYLHFPIRIGAGPQLYSTCCTSFQMGILYSPTCIDSTLNCKDFFPITNTSGQRFANNFRS